MRKPFLLRINEELWQDLNRWAADELRSVNGQIEFLLREAVERRKGAKGKGAGAERPSGEESDRRRV